MSSIEVQTYSAHYKVVDITAKVYAIINDSDKESLRQTIETNLIEYFNPEKLEFGVGVAPSNIIALIQTSASSINSVELESPSSNFNLKLNEFPMLGDIKLEIVKDTYRSSN
jgi:hypothetical protein